MCSKVKRLAVPCLAAAMALTGLILPKTLALFMDAETYSFLIYPYDGRGEGYLTFDNGATIHGYADGATCNLKYSFANSSAAIIKDLMVTFTFPDGSTTVRHLYDIASGAEKSIDLAVSLNHDMLVPTSGSDPDLPQKFRAVTAEATVRQFQESSDAGVQDVTVQTHTSTVYVYREGGSTP